MLHPRMYTAIVLPRPFFCSPLRGATPEDTLWNQMVAKAWCKKLVLEGKAPFAPHLFYTQFLDDTVKEEREAGIRAGLAHLFGATECLVDARAGISAGMCQEIEAARKYGVKVVMIMPGENVDIPYPRPILA